MKNSKPDKFSNDHAVHTRQATLLNLADRNFFPVVAELLQKEIRVRFRVTGRSMMPFLQGGEVITAVKSCGKDLETGNLLLVDDRQRILVHRLIKKTKIRGNWTYITKGDGASCYDTPVNEKNVLGKICLIERRTASGRSTINMESCPWKKINLSLALISRLRSNCSWLSRFPFKLRITDHLCRACFCVFAKRYKRA